MSLELGLVARFSGVHYNEFQSDSNTTNDNTAKVTNSNLKTIINNKLAELNLSGYSAKMIMNRSNLPIQLIEQVKIVQSMLRIERLAH
jgi:hypothetical protein